MKFLIDVFQEGFREVEQILSSLPERRMRFNCSEGTICVDLYSAALTYKKLGDKASVTLKYDNDLHGGGDAYIMKDLYDSMKNGTQPKCGGNEGLESAVFALSLDQSAREGKIVDLEPIWKSLNR